jgi:hypothetical protein
VLGVDEQLMEQLGQGSSLLGGVVSQKETGGLE